MRVTDRNQPLFLCKIGGQECHLPPEFCTLDGVPDAIRNDSRKMREVLGTCRKNPEEKIGEIAKFSELLFSQKSLGDWNIDISCQPVNLNC